MTVVRPDEETLSRQCLPYFVGVSGVSTPATGISMNLVIIPAHGPADMRTSPSTTPTSPALALVARNDAHEQESVELFHQH